MIPPGDKVLTGTGRSPAEDAAMHDSDRVWRERGLLSAVLAGDEQAWRTWYDESFEPLHAYVCWRCAGLRDLAEEVLQDTWLTAVRRIRTFDPEQGSFAGWLRGIAANVLRNHLRRRQVRNHKAGSTPAARLAEPADSELQRRDQAGCIVRVLADLPERYEAVLRAKYLDGLSMADIAAGSHETVKAVESLLTRARQAFREAYLRLEQSP
jgi:RNA polymerase sigma-70 factor (ECF subfamily)